MLKIPAIVHGPLPEVRRQVSRALRSFIAGESWPNALSATSMVDADSSPGLLVLNGPAPLLSGEPHFNVFLPLALLLEGIRKGKIPEQKKEEAVSASLSSPWGLLGVLAPANQMVVYPPHLHRPILSAALKHWDVLDSVGARYTVGLRAGTRLWDVTMNLHYVLGQLGVTEEQLRAPLLKGGLASLFPS